MLIASASKWVFAAGAVQARKGELSQDNIDKLHFTSGYNSFDICLPLPRETIDSCLARGDNGLLTPENVGKFFYNGGHLQTLASDLGWGGQNSEELADTLNALLGSQPPLEFQQPQPAGGIRWSAAGYAGLLQRLLRNELEIAALLGAHAVCTNPLAKDCNALSTPIPLTESWQYSLGHWVESDPKVGDQAVSSAGKFGFYPWIDAAKQSYGIVAREDHDSERAGYDSAVCGRKIRALWLAR